MGGMVWSGREWWFGHVTLIEVRKKPPTGIWTVSLTWIGLVVAEIWGEDSPPQYNLRFFESWGVEHGITFGRGMVWSCNFNRS
jgi:hypothetical protein